MNYNYDERFKSFKERLDDKVAKIDKEYFLGTYSEFGLRRRLSGEAQELAVQKLAATSSETSKFIGTSNVYLLKNIT
jgi:nicotinate phosphoribosyltransferase